MNASRRDREERFKLCEVDDHSDPLNQSETKIPTVARLAFDGDSWCLFLRPFVEIQIAHKALMMHAK